MGISVKAQRVSFNHNYEETFNRHYDSDGKLIEERILSSEGDYSSGAWEHVSTDNGRTWSEWTTVYDDAEKRHGKIKNSAEGDELLGANGYDVLSGDIALKVKDEVSGCRVGVSSTFYYLKGHDVGYFDIWEKGEDNMRTHAYFAFMRPDGTKVARMLEFEEGGADFDPENPRNPAFIEKNRAYAEDLQVLPDGDLSFMVYPNMRLACKLAGIDVNAYFPSCPDLMHGLMVARAHWDADKQDYIITYSNPITLGDLQSSRGVMEAKMTVLPSGRQLVVFRGACTMLDVWHTRTTPATPAFKWYSFSDDGGRTFSPAMPWHFDTREVVYSPASIHQFFRSKKNGKLYWIGNVILNPSIIDTSGSDPRWPLQICQVDEQYGHLIKDTLTEIDTRHEGESYLTELSNFNLLEDRETLELQLRLTKICQFREHYDEVEWYSEAWLYNINFDND